MKRLGLVSLAALCSLAAATPAQADAVVSVAQASRRVLRDPPARRPRDLFLVELGVGRNSGASARRREDPPRRRELRNDRSGRYGRTLMSATLSRENHHTVWKNWTPTRAGSYVVCTWLGDPAIATGSSSLNHRGESGRGHAHSFADIGHDKQDAHRSCARRVSNCAAKRLRPLRLKRREAWRSRHHRLP